MNHLAVPCPSCGSIEVVVGGPENQPAVAAEGGNEKPYIPQFHRCSCKACRHAFQHDFAFSR